MASPVEIVPAPVVLKFVVVKVAVVGVPCDVLPNLNVSNTVYAVPRVAVTEAVPAQVAGLLPVVIGYREVGAEP
jgi:hypothetical protein